MALHITEENFKEVLANNSVVVVDFSATWCGPCKALAPIVDKLATQYEGRAAICKADIEECDSIAQEFGIRSVPTILFFKDGAVQPDKKIVGATQEAKLAAAIDSLL